MYIIVKQLSKAKPTKNLHSVNCQKDVVKAESTPAMRPVRLVPTRAEIRPYLSAIQPKIRPPIIAPQKNMDWAIVGRAFRSHTQFN